MRLIAPIYTALLLLAMQACTESGADDGSDGRNIRLRAAVGSIENDSRAETGSGSDAPADSNPYYARPYLGTSLADSPLNAALWFRVKDDGTYQHDPTQYSELQLPVHTAMNFTRAQKEFVLHDGKNIKYPTNDDPVYCVGLYPNDEGVQDAGGNSVGWTLGSDNLTASHPIDGMTDLMFAPENRGTWTTPFDAPLQFAHLLTWVKIAVCATTHDTTESWGDIEQIEINSKAGVTVNLTTDLKTSEPTYENPKNADGTQTPDPFVKTMNAPCALQTTMQEVGSVLVSPETEYTLKIRTKNYPNGEIPPLKMKLRYFDKDANGNEMLVDVTDPSQVRGKCYVLSLYFKPSEVVEVVCVLNSWNNQSEDIYF